MKFAIIALMLLRCAVILMLAPAALVQGQALLGSTVQSMSFPTVSSPVIYGLGGPSTSVNPYPIKSTDSGLTWTPLYVFEAGTVQNVTGLAVDPSNPNIVYVTAQMNRGGVWKSTDGGQTWTSRVAGLPEGSFEPVDNLTVAVNAPQVLYIRIAQKLYKSVNGAETWTEHATLPNIARGGRVGLLPTTPTTGYFIARGAGAFRSSDDAKTWTFRGEMTVQGGFVEDDAVARCIAIDPNDTDHVYACIDVDASLGYTGIWGFWRSADGGLTWTNVLETPQTPAARNVLIDPRGSIVHFTVGFIGFTYARSINRGVSVTNMGVSIAPIAFDPRNPDLLWGNSGRRLSRDAGVTAADTNATFRPTFLRVTEPVNMLLEEGQTATNTIPVATAENPASVTFAATVTNAPWLTIPAQTSTTMSGLRVNVSAIGLAPGVYNATINLSSTQTIAAGSVPVTLTVTAPFTGASYELTLFAGGGTSTTENAPALSAQLTLASRLETDAQGRVYVSMSNRVKVIENGLVRSFAGNGQFTGTGNPIGDGGPATDATFMISAGGIAAAPDGRVFISDTSAHRVRVVQNGIITTYIPPTLTAGGQGFIGPAGLDLAPNGDLYIASFRGILRRPANEDRLDLIISAPSNGNFDDVKVAADGTIYYTDRGRHRVFRLRPGMAAESIAGTGVAGFNGDRVATEAQIDRPGGVDLDAEGNVWFVDNGNGRIRIITPEGNLRTVAGGGSGSTFTGAPAFGSLDVSLSSMSDLVFTSQGTPLFTSLSRIFRMTKDAFPRPRTVQGNFVNAGSYTSKVSPGALFSFFGRNMAASEAIASGSPWPTTLGGATVRINGTPVPLFYASPTQINGQVPYNLNIGQTYFANVTVNGLVSGDVRVTISASSPGFLFFGDNRAVVVNPDGLVNTSATPAKPLDVLVGYFVGIGVPNNPVPTGVAAPLDPLSIPTLPYKVFVGEFETRVLFLGLTPGFIGLGQVNFELPDLPPGDYPVTIVIGDEASNGPVITVGPK